MSNRIFKELFHPILLVVRHRRLLPGELLIGLVAVSVERVRCQCNSAHSQLT
jgi:hypothetical protein